MIAAEVGTTFTLGLYIVRISLRPDNPAFATYLIFRGDKLIGKQFSRPDEDACKWLERNEYSSESRFVQTSTLCQRLRGGVTHRRGRPRKADAERELQEAIAS